MKIFSNGIEWGGPDSDWYYFYWWNWLPKKVRFFGYEQIWWDGPHYTFGFWYFNISWSTYFWNKFFYNKDI